MSEDGTAPCSVQLLLLALCQAGEDLAVAWVRVPALGKCTALSWAIAFHLWYEADIVYQQQHGGFPNGKHERSNDSVH
jgi:hypothetical protein